jgi:tRNA-specific 2-thiouridylase
MMLPVGGFKKSEIRQIATEIGLRVADKKDSQEICFVAAGAHAQFVRDKNPVSTAGEIVTSDGRVVGMHEGIEGFTIGQRKGLRVAMGSPYFVTAIEPESYRVTIGPYSELGRNWLIASEANWLTDFPLNEPVEAEVQIRYNSSPQPATVLRTTQDNFRVEFQELCHGVSPGQLAAVFRGPRALGCGWIQKTG